MSVSHPVLNEGKLMFVRPVWKPKSESEIFEFIDAHEWALLVNNHGDQGPLATNLPLLLDRSRGPKGTLVGHIAMANEHAAALQASTTPTLAIFHGPYSYVTASWYPNRDMPSTYYYTGVHCYGRVTFQDEKTLEHWLTVLNDRMESRFDNGWKMNEVSDYDIKRRLKHILGFEIQIDSIEGKFKLGQDEPKKDALAVARHLAEEGSQRELSEMIHSYNVDRSEK